MIFLYTGTPGSGKSIHATVQIDAALKAGMDVICTYPIKVDAKRHKGRFIHMDIYDMNIRFLIRYTMEYLQRGKESQCLIVIDEASRIFNPKNERKDRIEWLEFLSMHRQLGYDMVIVTQNSNQLDKQVLAQVEIEIKHRKLTNFGFKGILVMLLMRKKFVAVKIWYPVKELIGRSYIGMRKRIKNMYNSMGMVDELYKKYLEKYDTKEKSRVEELKQIALEAERKRNEKANNGDNSCNDDKPIVVCEIADTEG